VISWCFHCGDAEKGKYSFACCKAQARSQLYAITISDLCKANILLKGANVSVYSILIHSSALSSLKHPGEDG